MNKQRLIIIVAALAGVLSIFLPWVSIPMIGSVNGTHGAWGWLGAGLYIISAAIAYVMGNRSALLSGTSQKAGVAVPAFASIIIGIFYIIKFKSSMSSSDLQDNPFAEMLSQSVSLQVGVFIFILSGIVIIAAAFYGGKLLKQQTT